MNGSGPDAERPLTAARPGDARPAADSGPGAGRPVSGTVAVPRILYEDNQVIVAVKPAGWLSQSDGRPVPDMLTVLKNYIRDKYAKPGEVFLGLVHRLDQPVSGLMVFARTSKAAARLSAQVRERQVDKLYLAVVHGHPQPAAGEIRVRLLKDPQTNTVRVDPAGLESVLAYDTVAFDTASGTSLLQIRLGTGRGHQIRVSLAHAGWPIVFDQKYGLPRDRGRGDVALFAWGLAFGHPTRPERLAFTVPPPAVPPFDRFEPFYGQLVPAFDSNPPLKG